MEEIDSRLASGEILEGRAAAWRNDCIAQTDRLIEHLDRDCAAIVAGLERDLVRTLRSFTA